MFCIVLPSFSNPLDLGVRDAILPLHQAEAHEVQAPAFEPSRLLSRLEDHPHVQLLKMSLIHLLACREAWQDHGETM